MAPGWGSLDFKACTTEETSCLSPKWEDKLSVPPDNDGTNREALPLTEWNVGSLEESNCDRKPSKHRKVPEQVKEECPTTLSSTL